jgi:hypothetical protein
MKIIVKTTNLAYHNSLGKGIREGLGVFVKKKVSLMGSNIQSKISLRLL